MKPLRAYLIPVFALAALFGLIGMIGLAWHPFGGVWSSTVGPGDIEQTPVSVENWTLDNSTQLTLFAHSNFGNNTINLVTVSHEENNMTYVIVNQTFTPSPVFIPEGQTVKITVTVTDVNWTDGWGHNVDLMYDNQQELARIAIPPNQEWLDAYFQNSTFSN